jgi:hypothetical protein
VNKRKTQLLGAAFFTLCSMQSHAQDATCGANGVVFGFFNGVQTTEDQAKFALRLIQEKQLYGTTTPNGEPITYELFYNDTEGFSDFVEVFDQRLQEHNGLLAGRFELFFSTLQGEGSWWDKIIQAVPALKDFYTSVVETFRAKLIRELSAHFGSPMGGFVLRQGVLGRQ